MSQTFIIQFNYLSILNKPCRGISPTRTVLVYIVIFYVSKYHMDIVKYVIIHVLQKLTGDIQMSQGYVNVGCPLH